MSNTPGNSEPQQNYSVPDSELSSRLSGIEQKLDEVISRSASLKYPNSSFSSPSADDEIDLRELWNVIWQGKWIIIATTFVFAVASVVYALSLPNIYKSEALLAPVEENSGGGFAGLTSQFGGLAGLAGVNLGGGANDKTSLALEILRSREFATYFIQKHDILIDLMAGKRWDFSSRKLILDNEIYDADDKAWVRKVSPPRTSKPSMLEAYKVFSDIFIVERDKKTLFINASVQFVSPVLAKTWLEWIVTDINLVMKKRDVEEAKNSIEYLNQELAKTSVADMKKMFYQLIEEQTKIIMFAEVREEYMFGYIDGPVIPELKIKPRRALICMLGSFLGGMVGVAIVFFFSFVVNGRHSKS